MDDQQAEDLLMGKSVGQPEHTEDYQRELHFRGRYNNRGKRLGQGDWQYQWFFVPCATPGCGGEAKIREDDLDAPEISRECLRCWSE